MNHRLRLLFLSTLLVTALGLFVPASQPALAADCTNATLETNIDQYGVRQELPDLPKYCSAADLTRKVLNIAFTLIASIAIIFVILGGYRYITSSGNSEAAEKGKKTVLYALAGLVVVILAVTAVNLVVNLLIYNKAF